MAFEPTERPHEYVSRGPGYSLRATSEGIDLASDASPVRLSLDGARSLDPQPEGLMSSQSHYYVGPDRSSWRIGVANYQQIRYESVYRGIDLVFHGADRQFEYDFLIAPFADPGRIRMRFEGAGNAKLNAAGDLVLAGSGFSQHRPRVVQEGREIPGAFHLHSNGTVSFQLGSYDHSKPLLIDPIITMATYLGGSWADRATDITVDGAGGVYVTGYTVSNNFPGNVTFGQRPNVRQFGFVTKYAPLENGKTTLLFTIFLGGSATLTLTYASAVRTDSEGNIIVVGGTNAPGFPLLNAIQSTIAGGLDCGSNTPNSGQSYQCTDAFVSKFTPDGRSLLFSTFYGGKLTNTFSGLALDSDDNIYAAGYAVGPTDLNGTAGAIQPLASSNNLQAVRFSPTGSLLYSTYLGSAGVVENVSIAVEGPGIVWVGTTTFGNNLPVTKSAFQPSFQAVATSAYLARIDMNLSGAAGLTYATYFGGVKGDTSLDHLFLDPSGQVVFCGGTTANIATTATAMQTTFQGVPQARVTAIDFAAGDGYVTRINSQLSGSAQVTYSSYVGGTDEDEAESCAVDSNGYLVVAGRTYSSIPFWTVGSPFPYKNGGIADSAFVIRIDPTLAGGRVDSIWFGGVNEDALTAMALDSHGYAYLTGVTFSQQFPVTSGAPQPMYGGDTASYGGQAVAPSAGTGDSWVAQINLNGPQVAVAALGADSGDFQFGAPGSILANPLLVHLTDANGNILPLAGYPVTFKATNATINITASLTDGTGLTGTELRLNTGTATVTASIAGAITPYTFHASAISGPLPTSVAILSGDGQSGPGGVALAQPLVVQLEDANQQPLAVAGITVQFQAHNAGVGAANVVTDAQGRASTSVTLGTIPGAMTVTIMAGSLPALTAHFTSTGPLVSSLGVTNGATFLSGPVCPGLLVTIFGSNVGPAKLQVNSAGTDSKFSSTLANTRVLFDGVPAPLIYVSATQTSAMVPYEVSGKTSTQMTVEYQGILSAAVTIPVADSQPGIFSSNSSGSGQGAILNEDFSVNSVTKPEKRGHIVQIYGTGGGATNPAGVDGLVATKVYPKQTLTVKVHIQGENADVLYSGAAPFLVAGVLQVNARIPSDIPDGNAIVELFVGDNQSPAVITVAVKGQ